MTSGFCVIATEDGTWLARDPFSGITASGYSLIEALSELRRLLSQKVAA